MTPSMVVEVFRQALWTTFWVSLPLLGIGLAVGIIVSLLQVATSIQDPSFSSVPRLAAFLFGLLILMPWMLNRLMSYTISLFGDFSRYAR